MIEELLERLHQVEMEIQMDSKDVAKRGTTTKGRKARANIQEMKRICDELRVALLAKMKAKRAMSDLTKDKSNYSRKTLDNYYQKQKEKA